VKGKTRRECVHPREPTGEPIIFVQRHSRFRWFRWYLTSLLCVGHKRMPVTNLYKSTWDSTIRIITCLSAADRWVISCIVPRNA